MLRIAGDESFLLGWNYWSRAGGPRMWEADRFDAAVVEDEIRAMRDAGANVCRSFVFLPTFMPRPPAVDAGAVARFRTFLDLCARHGLATLPSLLVGHMSGENYGFPGQRGRSPYTDPEVLAWTLALVDGVVGAARGHAAIAGWVLSNEMPLWGGKGEVATIVAWAQAVCDRVRAADPGRPVSVGDGVMNAKGGQNGFDAPALSAIVDWIGPHTYYSDTDAMRQGLQTELLVRSVQGLGRPVVLEEFGCSSSQASERGQAAYFRESIHGVYTLGGAGAIGWCASDFALADDPPYRHHAFELGFGAFRADGSAKAVVDEVRAFARLVGPLAPAATTFPAPRAAIVVPSYFSVDYPFSWEDRGRMRACLVEAYALAQRAGIEVAVVEERAIGERAYELYIVPSMQKLLEPTWHALAERVRAGAIAWVSYFHGDHSWHQGMWWHSFEEMTGLRHDLSYGVPEGPGPRVTVGDAELVVPPTADPFSSAMLPCEAVSAEVVLRDDQGRIALTKNALGRGALWFCTLPLEALLARTPHVHREDRAWHLYARVARDAGLGAFTDLPRATEHHPHVQAREVRSADRTLLWLINRSDRPATVRLRRPAQLLFARPDLNLGEAPAPVRRPSEQVAEPTESGQGDLTGLGLGNLGEVGAGELALGPKGVAVLVPAAQ